MFLCVSVNTGGTIARFDTVDEALDWIEASDNPLAYALVRLG